MAFLQEWREIAYSQQTDRAQLRTSGQIIL